MPKFKVCVHQYVEEIGSVTVFAETPEKAVEIAEQELADGNICNWQDGDDVIKSGDYGGVYAVLDHRGNDVVWER